MCRSGVSAAPSNKHTHTPLSRSDDNSIRLWGGAKARLTAPDRERKRAREKTEAERESDAEKNREKQTVFSCVSHRLSVLQFLPLSSTANYYPKGMTARSACSLSLSHTSKCLRIHSFPLMLINQRVKEAGTYKDRTLWTTWGEGGRCHWK